MNATELKKLLANGGLDRYAHLYANPKRQAKRMIGAIDAFCAQYGSDRDIALFSVPGRSEICGNHTDHNHGCVVAGAIDRDIVAVAAKNDDGVIRFHSEGYPEDVVNLAKVGDPAAFDNATSSALIAGMANAFVKNGYAAGGYDAYSTTEVLKGSGISSSAAFEVMVGNILNHFYNGTKVDPVSIAKYAQYAENVYFGKPCGLMDQTACAVGGFVFIDFENPETPVIEPIDFSLTSAGYALCIVNTGGNHANLTPDYAAIPAEMKQVAAALGKEVLRPISEETLVAALPSLRGRISDRALLRALHFVRENKRVQTVRNALKAGDVGAFFDGIRSSGRSSFQYLQNVYTTANVEEQGLSLALALTDGFLGDKGAYRVHGGGFAGTIQVFLPLDLADAYCDAMDKVFGVGSAMPLAIRPVGATRLF